ncbi:hypothetical protein MTO96_009528 [Rhipicephalus appendiculatus]
MGVVGSAVVLTVLFIALPGTSRSAALLSDNTPKSGGGGGGQSSPAPPPLEHYYVDTSCSDHVKGNHSNKGHNNDYA